MRPEVAATLVCPHDRTRLSGTGDRLTCEQGHRFPVCGGIPVLVLDDGQAMHVSVARAGVDHNFGRLVIARRVCRQLGVEADFVCADARRLPFADRSVDVAFSYSVIQHFSKDQARRILAEVGRLLAAGGTGMIQMPNRYGIRSLYHQLRKTWTPARPFDVRYWTPRELLRDFEAAIGPSHLTIDGFFGLGIQARDSENFLPHHRAIVGLSERLRRAPWLAPVADSLYVHSTARAPQSTT